MGHQLRSIEEAIGLWRRTPAGWDGLSSTGAHRFLGKLQAVTTEVGPRARKDEVRTGRELALRSAALYRSGMKSSGLERISAGARDLLTNLMKRDEGAISWALSEVIAWDSSMNRKLSSGAPWRPSTKERRIMLGLVSDLKTPKLRGALLAIGQRKTDPLRSEALSRLGRWAADFGPDEVVDLFLVKLLGRASDYRDGPHPMNVILERIDSTESPLGERAQAALRERIAHLLIAPDWRQSAIGLRLSRGLTKANQIPMLLDGLNVWNQRHLSERPFTSMVRVRGDITRELQDLSGMKHGPEPGPWINWWVEVQQGKRPMPGTPEFEAEQAKRNAEPLSTAGFFGLKPTTDRVTFIIDHSGSMEHSWGTTERSRYSQAIDQMLRFLQGAAPGTKFNVILFDDSPLRSSLGLVDATPKNLERARKSLMGREPDGGTYLRPAVELALGLGPDGLPSRRITEASEGDDVPADTIVILCDGATQEGSGWVAPMLKRVLPLYPVVFHTVHLGPTDDGTLSALAKGSGGDFLRVTH